MSPRKPSSQELTREMIINEARNQFLRKDFHQVSMRSIAKELGCSHGAIYYHFKNKAELFYGIVEESFSELNSLMDRIAQGQEDNRTKLYQLFLSFIEFGLNHQNQYELMFMTRNDEVDGLNQQAAYQSYEKYAQLVQSLSPCPLLIKDVYAAFISLHGFVSFYHGYVQTFEEAKETAKAHVEFILKGLIG